MAVVGVCEDDSNVRRVLVEALRGAGHSVVPTSTGGEALRALGPSSDVEVAILDIGLPDADGRDLCLALRSAGQHCPVLFLTALDAVHDRVSGFHAGGDDYLPKPFAVGELLVRIDALLRRAPTAPEESGVLRLDPTRHAAVHADTVVALTPTEYRLLATLSGRPGEVVRRRTLVLAGWPPGAIVNDNTLDSYIRRLRTKLSELGAPASIDTVRGVGYALR